MSAIADNPFYASPVPALPPDTTPAAIRDALIGEERAEFERVYRDAMIEAARTLDLTRVLNVLRNYHRIAWPTHSNSHHTPGAPTWTAHRLLSRNPGSAAHILLSKACASNSHS